jgi:hypothetical protein
LIPIYEHPNPSFKVLSPIIQFLDTFKKRMLIDDKRFHQNVKKLPTSPFLSSNCGYSLDSQLGKSPADQIDGTLLLLKQHNHFPIACPMLMLVLWNSPVPLHINNTHSPYLSKSMPRKCSNFKKLLRIP